MRSREAGYAALLALVTLAMVSFGALAAFSAQSAQRAALRRASASMMLDVAAANAQGRLGYLLLSEPMGLRGLLIGGDRTAAQLDPAGQTGNQLRNALGVQVRELIFDGRAYEFASFEGQTMRLQIQDSAGLLNLNDPDQSSLSRFFERRRSRNKDRVLADTLADYVDADNLRRRFGAEQAEYEALGLLLPRNGDLTSVRQALGAIAWSDILSAEPSLFTALSARTSDGGLNPNTAPPHALRAGLNVNERALNLLLSQREERPYLSPDDLVARSGLASTLAAGRMSMRPNGEIIVRVSLPNDEMRANAFRLRALPNQTERPLLVEPLIGREVFLMETAYAGVRPLPSGDHNDPD